MSKRGAGESTPRWQVAIVAVLVVVLVPLVYVALQKGDPVDAGPNPLADWSPSAAPVPQIPAARDGGSALAVTYLGTSLGSGFYASSEAKSYQGRITGALGKFGKVDAQRAERRKQKPGALTMVVTYPPRLLPPKQDLIVVELGTNDAGRTSLDAFTKQYDALLSTARKGSPGALFVCLGPWQADPGVFDEAIRDACGEYDGRYVPMSDLYQDDANHGPPGRETIFGTSDVFHPNDAGHKAIADRVLSQLPDYLATPGESVPSPPVLRPAR